MINESLTKENSFILFTKALCSFLFYHILFFSFSCITLVLFFYAFQKKKIYIFAECVCLFQWMHTENWPVERYVQFDYFFLLAQQKTDEIHITFCILVCLCEKQYRTMTFNIRMWVLFFLWKCTNKISVDINLYSWFIDEHGIGF